MIKEILGGFHCDEALKTEAEKLAKSPFATERAMAVGMIGSYWRPASIEEAVKAMIGGVVGDAPIARAQNWARSMSEEELVSVETEHRLLSDGHAKDLTHLLSADEGEWTEAEREHVRATDRKLGALGFILNAIRDPLEDTVRLAETG